VAGYSLCECVVVDDWAGAGGTTSRGVQLSAALELGHLDDNELEAALSDVTLALVNHVPALWQMATAEV
jgi:CesT_Tir_1